MPDRIEVQDLSCPAGTTATDPLVLTLAGVVACQVRRVSIRIAPGHAGKTGIALGYGLNAVIPRRAGAYISGDDEVLDYDLTGYVQGPQWQAFLVNTDTQAHVWETRFEVDELTDIYLPAASSVIEPSEIYAAGSALIGTA